MGMKSVSLAQKAMQNHGEGRERIETGLKRVESHFLWLTTGVVESGMILTSLFFAVGEHSVEKRPDRALWINHSVLNHHAWSHVGVSFHSIFPSLYSDFRCDRMIYIHSERGYPRFFGADGSPGDSSKEAILTLFVASLSGIPVGVEILTHRSDSPLTRVACSLSNYQSIQIPTQHLSGSYEQYWNEPRQFSNETIVPELTSFIGPIRRRRILTCGPASVSTNTSRLSPVWRSTGERVQSPLLQFRRAQPHPANVRLRMCYYVSPLARLLRKKLIISFGIENFSSSLISCRSGLRRS